MKKINYPFHTRLFINISTVVIFIISLCTGIVSCTLYKNLMHENRTSQEQITVTTGQLIDKLIDDMDNLALFISSNPNVTNAFSSLYFDNTIENPQKYLSNAVMDTLTAVTIPNSSTRFRINLFNQKGNFLTTGIPVNFSVLNNHVSNPDYQMWYSSLPLNQCKPFLLFAEEDYLTVKPQKFVSLYREIFHPSHLSLGVGIVEIQCPESLFLTILDTNAPYSYNILDQNGTPLITNRSQEDSSSDPKNYILTKQELNCGYTLCLYQSKISVYRLILPFVFSLILTSLLILSIMTYVIFVIAKHTTKPLCTLIKQIETVSLDNLKIDTSKKTGINEVDKLYKSFSQMCNRLTVSIDENLRIKSCELRSNLIALQSQMNPHFLYNTLAIIKAMTKENNTKQICNICDYLSKMLRYASSHEQSLVSLDTELEQSELYLKLMKIRYEDLFEYKIDIQPGFDPTSKKIIKLSIQPILENCFQHGFKKVLPIWKIHIKCWQTDSYWYLSISDNGYGITTEEIEILKNRVSEFLNNPSDTINELSIGKMGLINTIARLNLSFKDDFSYKISRLEHCGTKIELRGVNYDEHNDR